MIKTPLLQIKHLDICQGGLFVLIVSLLHILLSIVRRYYAGYKLC